MSRKPLALCVLIFLISSLLSSCGQIAGVSATATPPPTFTRTSTPTSPPTAVTATPTGEATPTPTATPTPIPADVTAEAMSSGGTQTIDHDLGYQFVLSDDWVAAPVTETGGSPSVDFSNVILLQLQQQGPDIPAVLAVTKSFDLSNVRLFAFTRNPKYENVNSPDVGEQLPYIIVKFYTGAQETQLPVETLVASNEQHMKEQEGAKILENKWPGNPNVDVGSFAALEQQGPISLIFGFAMFHSSGKLVLVTLVTDSRFWDSLSPSMGEIISTLKLLP